MCTCTYVLRSPLKPAADGEPKGERVVRKLEDKRRLLLQQQLAGGHRSSNSQMSPPKGRADGQLPLPPVGPLHVDISPPMRGPPFGA
jgi:hypothetical protein